ncbi:tRNA (uracil-5-)-methyltransferase homolog A-like [Condylostylus longicornis]|uniref:tRNA (uracil-5-)-methyltransferase homolog A-like n=1 Tax=Condylostylus longicornis TaxID=2530218 RepID=UPI00244DF804|nr:tRNA (uracil-5-)-methyltransferase homolog A-like [Condylostylus longicornis]
MAATDCPPRNDEEREQATETAEEVPEKEFHPLRLYMASPEIKTMKTTRIAETLKPSETKPPNAKKRKLNPELVLKNDDEKSRLLWCHPEVAKGFNGCLVDRIIESEIRLGYRNKCEFTIGFQNDELKDPEEIVVGCKEEFPVYSRSKQKGVWRILMVRSSERDNGLMLVTQIKSLSASGLIREGSSRTEDDLRASLIALLIDGLVYSDGSSRTSLRLYDGMFIKSLYIQETNTKACAALYQRAFEMLDVSKSGLVLDICSGAGTIALALHHQLSQRMSDSRTPRIVGIELVPEAVESAKMNAEINAIDEKSVEFLCGKAEVVLPELLANIENEVEVCAIVDPPRAGLHPTVCRSLVECQKINHLVYISCNPDSLVEDVLRLCTPTLLADTPFKPIKAVGVDMFPHTYHCEMILQLSRTTENDFGFVQNRADIPGC